MQVLSGGNFLNNTLNPTYASVDVASGGYITIVADGSARNTTVGALTGAGNIIRNTQTGTATLIVGNGNADGDFSGVIDQTAFLGGAGAIALTKVGTGTQIFSGSSNHTGATFISGGSLMLGDGGAGGALSPSSTITNNGNFTVFQSDTVTQGTDFSSSSIAGTGSLTARGTGTLVLNAANAYGGGTSIGVNIAGQRVGVIRATASGALGSGTVNIGPGGNDTTARLELSGGVALSNPIALAGRGSSSTNNTVAIQNLGGSNTLSGTITIGTGGSNYRIQSDAGLLTLSNATAITAAVGGIRVVTLQGAGNGLVSGAITQTGGTIVALVKEGAGTWTLSGSNTYDGGTTINGGRVVIGGPAGLLGANTAANAVVVNTNGTLEFGRAGGPWVHPITGTGNVDVSATTVSYSGDLSGFDGDVNILAGGRFALGADNSGSANASWRVSGILSLSGTRSIALGELSGNGQIFTGGGVNTPVNTFTVGGLNTDSAFTGTIGTAGNNGMNLTKVGTGTLTLSGNNTYNGATNINDGTLLVNGSHTGGGAYTVATAGTLGGSGNIIGAAVSLSGTVAPGDGVGTLSADNLTWQSGGVYDWEIANSTGTAGVDWDLLDLTGGMLAFAGGGPFDVDIDATAATFTAQNYLFEIARANSISAFNASSFTLDVEGANDYQWSIRQQGNSIFLQAVVLPEPATWILFAVGGVVLGCAGWLRCARVKISN